MASKSSHADAESAQYARTVKRSGAIRGQENQRADDGHPNGRQNRALAADLVGQSTEHQEGRQIADDIDRVDQR
jgi:hypothetical protein